MMPRKRRSSPPASSRPRATRTPWTGRPSGLCPGPASPTKRSKKPLNGPRAIAKWNLPFGTRAPSSLFACSSLPRRPPSPSARDTALLSGGLRLLRFAAPLLDWPGWDSLRRMAGFRLRSFSTGCAPNGARSLPIRSCATRLSACSTAFPSRHPAPCNWPPRLPGPPAVPAPAPSSPVTRNCSTPRRNSALRASGCNCLQPERPPIPRSRAVFLPTPESPPPAHLK